MTLNESIGRFNVRKTLRFEMRPLGKTAECLDVFLASDEGRAESLNTVKSLIEAEPSPDPTQKKRLNALDALLAESLVTREEYDAKRREILGEAT